MRLPAALLGGLVLFAPARADEAWVSVNGRALSLGEFRRQLRWSPDSAGRRTLARMIERELLAQEAARLGVEPTEAEVEAHIERLWEAGYAADLEDRPRTRAQARAALEADLERDGLSIEDLRALVRRDLGISRVLERLVLPKVKKPSDRDLRRAFERLRAAAAGKPEALEGLPPEEVPEYVDFAARLEREHAPQARVSQILLRARSPEEKRKALRRAQRLKERLDRGEPFDRLAREESEDPLTAQLGGDMGFVRKGWSEAALERVVDALDVGEVSAPVESSEGWRLLRVRERRSGEPLSFERLAGRLSGFLYRLGLEREYRSLRRRLARKAQIRVARP